MRKSFDTLAHERAELMRRAEEIEAEIKKCDELLKGIIEASTSKDTSDGKYHVNHIVTADGIALDSAKAKKIIADWETKCSKATKGKDYITLKANITA